MEGVTPSPKGEKEVGGGSAPDHLRPEGWWGPVAPLIWSSSSPPRRFSVALPGGWLALRRESRSQGALCMGACALILAFYCRRGRRRQRACHQWHHRRRHFFRTPAGLRRRGAKGARLRAMTPDRFWTRPEAIVEDLMARAAQSVL